MKESLTSVPSTEARLAVEEQLEHILAQCNQTGVGQDDTKVQAYLQALKLVAKEALRWLDKTNGRRVLQLHDYPSGRSARSILSVFECSLPSPNTINIPALSKHRKQTCALLLGGMVDEDSALGRVICAAGGTLYRLLLRRASRDIERRPLMRDTIAANRIYIDEMRRTTLAEFDKTVESSKSARFEIAFRTAMKLRSVRPSKSPRLILVHDIDRNLTPTDDHYVLFPEFDLWSRVHSLHRDFDYGPPEARFAVLSIFGACHPSVRHLWYSQLRLMGSRLPGMLFSDARQLFASEAAKSTSLIESCFVTGNNTTVAAQMAVSLGLPKARIWGVDETGLDGFDKPLALLEIIRDNPGAIVVVSDDGDPELVQTVRQSTEKRSVQPVGLADLVLFVARQPNQDENYVYSLEPALAQAGYPYLSNVLQARGSDDFIGYQGMNQVVRLYKSLTAH